MSLTAEQLKAAPVLTEKVMTPELGGDGHVYVRELSLRGREDWERWSARARTEDDDHPDLNGVIEEFGGWRGYLLARALSDEQGVLLFSDPDKALEVLGDCPHAVMERVYQKAVELNTFDDEDLEGNSPDAPSDDST